MLGVTIGVAAVVILTALGEGAQRYITNEFASLGSNLLIVIPGKNETSGGFPTGGVPNDLTLDDARILQRELRSARHVVPLSMGNETVSHLERSRQVIVLGSTHEFLKTRELEMGVGEFLPADDIDRGSQVTVLGATLAEELFPNTSPIGKVARIGDWRMRVIGVLARRGKQMGLDIDELAIVPVSSAMRIFNQTSLFRILIKVRAYADIEPIRDRIVQIITERHDEEDITCITQESVIESLSRILDVLTFALAGIAAISLTVAGLGIMNLMLVSVSERTREIGLLKALGANRRQILQIFLTEAILLTSAGSFAGVVLGTLASQLFKIAYPNVPVAPPVWALLGVVVVALGSGILFGVLPARRAARLDPVVALSGH